MEAIEPPRVPLTPYLRYQNKCLSEAKKSNPFNMDSHKIARDASAR